MNKGEKLGLIMVITGIVSMGATFVVGGGDVGCETACHLADNGFDVTIVEMLSEILTEALMTEIKLHMLHLLKEKNIKIMTNTKVNQIIDEGVEVILSNNKMDGLNADVVAFAINLKADNQLIKILSMKAEEVYVVGDASSPGRIKEAVKAGEETGRRL